MLKKFIFKLIYFILNLYNKLCACLAFIFALFGKEKYFNKSEKKIYIDNILVSARFEYVLDKWNYSAIVIWYWCYIFSIIYMKKFKIEIEGSEFKKPKLKDILIF